MKIALIRHFATKGNLEKRYIGTTDEGILPEAVKTGRTYPKVQTVIASPMKRCQETARFIYGGEPYLCEAFRECDFGLFENRNYEELKEEPAYQKWLASMGKDPFPEGESAEVFKERCRSGFYRCVDQLMKENIQSAAMVVHGGTIMAVMEAYGVPKKEFYDRQAGNGEGYLVSICEDEWKRGIRNVMEEARL